MHKPKKIFASLLIFVSIIGMLTGCGADTAKEDVIKIGQMAVLSGGSAAWGQAEANGAKMAVDEINAAGGINGKKVELITYDNKGTATEGITSIKKLIDQDKVCAIIGGNMSDILIAVAPIYTEAKIPIIATMPANSLVTLEENGQVRDYAFRLVFADQEQGIILAEFVANELKANTVGILYQAGLDYSVGIAENFANKFKELGGTIVEEVAFQTDEVDFRPQLTKIKEKNPDVLFVPVRYKEAALAANQARDLGIDAMFVGTDGWNSPVLIEMGQKNVEGAFTIAHQSLDDPDISDFREKYNEIFQIEPEVNALYAYDAMMLLADAIKRAGSSDPQAIRDALAATDGFQGVTGKIQFSPETHNVVGKEALILRIENGKFKIYTKFTPSQ